MNDELFKSLASLVKTTEAYYAKHPDHVAADDLDPTAIAYQDAFIKAKRALKKYEPVAKIQAR